VAEVFGIKPVPEEEATEKKIYEALQTSRYVHLSTHGRHNVEALLRWM
jgi:hypothetical protein